MRLKIVVAEALRLVRTKDFETGFAYLNEKAPSRWMNNPASRREWFTNKCREHNLL